METPKVEPAIAVDASLLKPKVKREQSEKQKAVWAKAQQTRIENAKVKRELVTKIKEDKIARQEAKLAKYLAKKPIPKIIYESDSEPEVVVIKKKKPVVYQEESSSEDEAPPPKKKAAPIVQQQEVKKPLVRFF